MEIGERKEQIENLKYLNKTAKNNNVCVADLTIYYQYMDIVKQYLVSLLLGFLVGILRFIMRNFIFFFR